MKTLLLIQEDISFELIILNYTESGETPSPWNLNPPLLEPLFIAWSLLSHHRLYPT